MEMGTLTITGSLDTKQIDLGVSKVVWSLDKVKTQSKSLNSDFERTSAVVGTVTKRLGALSLAGATAMVGLAKSAPALAGAFANIDVSMFRLSNTLGNAIKPQMDWLSGKLSDFADWADKNPDLFSGIFSGLVIGGTILTGLWAVNTAITTITASLKLLGLAGAGEAATTATTATGSAASAWELGSMFSGVGGALMRALAPIYAAPGVILEALIGPYGLFPGDYSGQGNGANSIYNQRDRQQNQSEMYFYTGSTL